MHNRFRTSGVVSMIEDAYNDDPIRLININRHNKLNSFVYGYCTSYLRLSFKVMVV